MSLARALINVALALVIAGQGLILYGQVKRKLADRRQRKRMKMRLEVCEHPGCGKELRPHEVYELRSTPEDDAELGVVGPGGTWMSAVFCRKHYPGPPPRRRVWSRVARRRHP